MQATNLFTTLLVTLLATNATAQTVSNFNNDTLNDPPTTGGLHQPTAISIPTGGQVKVVDSPFGLEGPAVCLSDDDGQYSGLTWDIDSVSAGVLRIEATVSFRDYVNSFFLQATNNVTPLLRLWSYESGLVRANGVELGTYTPETPFRVRVDIDFDRGDFSAVIDPELDGFADNQVELCIPFLSPEFVVDRVWATFTPSGSDTTNEAVAFDDVYIGPKAIGSRYCSPAEPNSAGWTAELSAVGSYESEHNLLQLEASNLPSNELGYFLVSSSPSFVANPGGSQGNLCLGGTIGRFVAQAQDSGTNGRIAVVVDLLDLPQIGTVMGGDTLHFQCWYRDGASSNFSNAVTVPFL